MPATKTNEIAFNVHLFDVLRTKHPRWRDHAGVEQTAVFRDVALQPDLVIHPPGGVPVIIETEFEPARSVEQDARARLGKRLQYNGDLIEQTIAVKVPKNLRRVQQGDLTQHIETAEFHYCTYSGQEERSSMRWPAEGWLAGSVDDMAGCIENVSLSERLLAEGTEILEQSIGEAAGKVRETAGAHALAKIAQSLHQEDGEQTSRMAMAIIANALVFHTAIVSAHGIETIDELRRMGSVNKSRVLACWQHILDHINYYPIFHIASELLRPIPDSAANAVLNRLAQAASDLAGLGATTLHDLSGRMFQRLIADRKFLATFYTLPTSAALLGELAVSRIDADWSNEDALVNLQVADLACGTGALLSAAYRALASRHRRTRQRRSKTTSPDDGTRPHRGRHHAGCHTPDRVHAVERASGHNLWQHPRPHPALRTAKRGKEAHHSPGRTRLDRGRHCPVALWNRHSHSAGHGRRRGSRG